MALDSSKVRVAVTGAVSVAVSGSTAPTDASTALAVAFKEIGYVSEDGITEARSRSTNDIKGWQNSATLRTVVTEGSMTFAFTMVETNTRTVELFYGATVATTAIVVIPTATGGRKAFVIDVVDGAELCRIWIPDGEVTDVGEVVYAAGEPVGYPVTIAAYPNTTLGGSVKKFYSALVA